MDSNVAAARKRYSRPHTKEERRQEKKRRRERIKLLKNKQKEQNSHISVGDNNGVAVDVNIDVKKVEQSVQTDIQTKTDDQNDNRGMKMVKLANAARKKETERSQFIPVTSTKPVTINRKDLSKQDEGDIIGSGSYGVCYKGFYRGNIPVVIKSFKQLIQRSEVQREARAIEELQRSQHHTSLPLLFGVNLDKLPFLLVSQLHGGQETTYTLNKALQVKLLNNTELTDLAIQLAKTLGYIHSRDWLHNDMKENNVVLHMIHDSWNLVIIDFGKSCKTTEAKIKTRMVQDASRYYWIAPEVLQAKSPPSVASDIFSLGMILKKLFPKIVRDANPIFKACISQIPENRPKNAHTVASFLLSLKKNRLNKKD